MIPETIYNNNNINNSTPYRRHQRVSNNDLSMMRYSPTQHRQSQQQHLQTIPRKKQQLTSKPRHRHRQSQSSLSFGNQSFLDDASGVLDTNFDPNFGF